MNDKHIENLKKKHKYNEMNDEEKQMFDMYLAFGESESETESEQYRE